MTTRFPALHIGPLAIGPPVAQAALSGYSDAPMRVIARRLGAGYTVGEVWLDRFVVEASHGRRGRRLLAVRDEEHPCGAQLMGSRPEEFIPAALALVRLGFDAIDLNLACPVRKVLARRRGGFLMGQPDVALEIVSRVRDALPPEIPVTVKLRSGLDESPESRERFFAIFDGAFGRGAAAATVHPRTVAQRYAGRAAWAFLAEVKRHAIGRIVLGSGDLFRAEDCLAMLRQTGVDGACIARGAIGNPWIFAQVRALLEGRPLPPPPSVYEQRDVIVEHYRMAEEVYGPKRSGRRMRKFGIRYAQLHPQYAEVRAAFIATRRPGDVREVLRRWYADDLPGRWPDVESFGRMVEGHVECDD
ncbi:MAG: tRNA-dihydrouridine synthase [Pirellulales bacterium]|nr:tRNA-dihydrouridine synthase [Pirellulales bacterium]